MKLETISKGLQVSKLPWLRNVDTRVNPSMLYLIVFKILSQLKWRFFQTTKYLYFISEAFVKQKYLLFLCFVCCIL